MEKSSVSLKAKLDQEEIHDHNNEDAARKFKAIKAWWQDMAERNNKFVTKPASSCLQQNATHRSGINIQEENAAKLVQSRFKGLVERRNFLKMINAISFLQAVIRAWLMVKRKSGLYKFSSVMVQEFAYARRKQSEKVGRYVRFIIDRHSFVKLRRSVPIIQQAVRIWLTCRQNGGSIKSRDVLPRDLVNAATVVQKYVRGWIVRSRNRVSQMTNASFMFQGSSFNYLDMETDIAIQHSCKTCLFNWSLHDQHLAATKIQCYFRGWIVRRKFLNMKRAITKIQHDYRFLRYRKSFQQLRIATRSAIIIQSHVRGWIVWRRAWRHRYLIGVLQRSCRRWLVRRDFLVQRDAVTKIQSAIRCFNCWKSFHCHKNAATEIQRFVRGQIVRNRLLGASHFYAATSSHCNFLTSRGCFHSSELKIVMSSILKLQRWWRAVLLLRLKAKSAIIIQSHVRGWIGRQKASRERQQVVVIQSFWKGYLARKESRGQLLELRLRVQKSSKNVDDSRRIINRLIRAVSELQNMKSISGILHTCATLDMTTEHSQKCCEHLVEAGAIDALVKLIRSVSRSIPDQEVLKHALSTLRNLTRYPHLVEVLIDSHGSVEIILWELLRNKEAGYFIASEVLKKICSNQKGVEAVRKLPALLKRLYSLVEELTRKATAIEKRKPQVQAVKENTERRLIEAVELLKLVTNN